MGTSHRETPLATIERVGPDRVVVRFKPAVRVDAQGIAEIMAVRKALCGSDRVSLLMVLPSEVELDMQVISTDHYRINDSAEQLIAVAVVAEGSMGEMMARLYYAYFPPTFPCEVFTREEEAALWLEKQVRAKA